MNFIGDVLLNILFLNQVEQLLFEQPLPVRKVRLVVFPVGHRLSLKFMAHGFREDLISRCVAENRRHLACLGEDEQAFVHAVEQLDIRIVDQAHSRLQLHNIHHDHGEEGLEHDKRDDVYDLPKESQ